MSALADEERAAAEVERAVTTRRPRETQVIAPFRLPTVAWNATSYS